MLVNCDHTVQCTADILMPHERAIALLFWHQQWLVGDDPFRLKFALKVTHPPPSKHADLDRYPLITSQPQEIAKLQLWRIGSWPWAFQRAIDGGRTLPLHILQKVAQKVIFKNKLQLKSNKVCYFHLFATCIMVNKNEYKVCYKVSRGKVVVSCCSVDIGAKCNLFNQKFSLKVTCTPLKSPSSFDHANPARSK